MRKVSDLTFFLRKNENFCIKKSFFYLSGIDLLENQVKEAKQMVEESDIKYDEVARKLAMVSWLKRISIQQSLSGHFVPRLKET